MKKKELLQFIEKYSLGSQVESVKWEISQKTAKVLFNTEDKTLIGNVSMKQFDNADMEFGIYETSTLVKMLSAVGEDLDFKVNQQGGKSVNITLVDDEVNLTYILSDPAIIPKAGIPKQLPDFEHSFEITTDFINKFNKTKGAIDSTIIAFKSKDAETIELIHGFNQVNSNRITFSTKAKSKTTLIPICFNSDYLKAVLNANKDLITGTLYISSAGLLKLEFDSVGYTSQYFMVKLELN